jgi:hypothetical protein
MTSLFRIFKRPHAARQSALASDIAARCASQIMSRIGSKTATMTPPELRGYLRAVALPMVRSYIQNLLADQQVPSPQRDDFLTAVLERTVERLVHDLRMPPVIHIPSPHVQTRRAA